jgi:hypothetical protein
MSSKILSKTLFTIKLFDEISSLPIVVKRCTFNGKPFNTQIKEELAGSSSRNDIECNFINVKDIGIEAKKFNTPDWMQCSIKYNNDGTWSGVEKSKIPIKSREIFNNVINDINLYDGEIPPFFKKTNNT